MSFFLIISKDSGIGQNRPAALPTSTMRYCAATQRSGPGGLFRRALVYHVDLAYRLVYVPPPLPTSRHPAIMKYTISRPYEKVVRMVSGVPACDRGVEQ